MIMVCLMEVTLAMMAMWQWMIRMAVKLMPVTLGRFCVRTFRLQFPNPTRKLVNPSALQVPQLLPLAELLSLPIKRSQEM